MNEQIASLLAQQGFQTHQALMNNIANSAMNANQGLMIVNTALIQTNAQVSDDPAVIAALQTASRAPVQGANDAIK